MLKRRTRFALTFMGKLNNLKASLCNKHILSDSLRRLSADGDFVLKAAIDGLAEWNSVHCVIYAKHENWTKASATKLASNSLIIFNAQPNHYPRSYRTFFCCRWNHCSFTFYDRKQIEQMEWFQHNSNKIELQLNWASDSEMVTMMISGGIPVYSFATTPLSFICCCYFSVMPVTSGGWKSVKTDLWLDMDWNESSVTLIVALRLIFGVM